MSTQIIEIEMVLISSFENQIINASFSNILTAAIKMTAVEFRLWINACNTFPNTHPSHYIGAEKRFIKTGSWDLEVDENDMPTDISYKEATSK